MTQEIVQGDCQSLEEEELDYLWEHDQAERYEAMDGGWIYHVKEGYANPHLYYHLRLGEHVAKLIPPLPAVWQRHE